MRFAIVIERPAVQTAGAPRYHDGSEVIAPNTPVIDARGNLVLDQDGNVRLWTAAELTIRHRELYSWVPGTATSFVLEADVTSGLTVTVAGAPITTFTRTGRLVTITGVPGGTATGARVVITYMGPRLHTRGTPFYALVCRPVRAGDLRGRRGQAGARQRGAHLPRRRAGLLRVRRPAGHAALVQRLAMTGTAGLGDAIFHVGIEELTVITGGGDDDVTVVSTHTGTTRIETRGGADRVAVRTIAGDTTILTGTGDDHILVGSAAGFWPGALPGFGGFYGARGVTDGISAFLDLDAGAGVDRLELDDTADASDNTGTLERVGATLQLRGLDMAEGVDYTGVEQPRHRPRRRQRHVHRPEHARLRRRRRPGARGPRRRRQPAPAHHLTPTRIAGDGFAPTEVTRRRQPRALDRHRRRHRRDRLARARAPGGVLERDRRARRARGRRRRRTR